MVDAVRDQNHVPVALGVSSVDGVTPLPFKIDPITGRLLADMNGGGGTVNAITGTINRITVDSTDPANPIIDIASTYVGQSSIITLGTITTGVWNGTDIALAHGGTGVSLVDPDANAIFIWDNTTNATRLALLSGLTYDSATNTLTVSSGSGDVIGPASATDNALVRFDTTTGKLLQNGTIISSDVIAGQVIVSSIGDNDLVLQTGNAITGLIIITDGVNGNITLSPDGTGKVIIDTELNFSDATSYINVGGSKIFELNNDLTPDNYFSFTNNSTSPLIMEAKGGDTNLDIRIIPKGTGSLVVDGNILPLTNDDGSIGSISAQYSDMFLAEGGVINWDNGDVTLTQTGDQLALGGGYFSGRVRPRVTSTTSASSLTPTLATADRYVYTALAANFTLNNPSAMEIGEIFVLQITDNSTIRTLAFGTDYVGLNGQALPTTTTDDKCMEIICSKVAASKILVSYVAQA